MNAGELSVTLTADTSQFFAKLAEAAQRAEAEAKAISQRMNAATANVIQPGLIGPHGMAGFDSWRKQARDATGDYNAKWGGRFQSLAAEMAKAEVQTTKAEKAVGEFDKATKSAGQSSVDMAVRVGKIGVAVGAAGHAMSIFAAVAKDMRTGGTAIIGVMEQLPFGLGAVARGFHSLYDEVSGFNQEMEKADALLESAAKKTEEAGRAKAAALAHENTMAALEAEFAIEAATTEEKKASLEFDRQRLQIMLDYDAALRSATTDAEQEAAREEMATKRAIVNEKEKADLKRRTAEADKKYGEDRAKAIADETKANREAKDAAKSVLQAAQGTLEDELRRLNGVGGRDFIDSSQTAIGTFNLAAPNAARAMADNQAKQLSVQQAILQVQKEMRDLQKSGGGGWN